MKIQTITRRLLNRRRLLVAFCVATMTTVGIGSTANAQTGGLMQYLTQPRGSNAQTAQQATRQGSISNGGQNFRVVSASTANVRTAADSNRPASSVQKAGGANDTQLRGPIGSAIQGQATVQQTSYGSGCTSCPTGQCGSACGGSCNSGSCGGSVGGFSGGAGGYVSGGGWGCGSCQPYQFASVEALYMERRGDNRFTLADDFGMSGFDFEWGTRITIGSVPDCVHGCEFTLVTPMEWDMTGSLVDAGAGINTLLSTGGSLVPADLSAFNNATGQRQTYAAEYWSLEGNKTLIGWDVAKLLIGARYIDYDEDYGYTTRNNAGQTGVIRSSTDNQLFGAQIGMDLLYPVARHLYTDLRARAGAYLNFADADINIVNNGSTIIRNGDEDEEIAGMFELGMGLRYNLGQALSVRGGTELWYLTGVATVPDQYNGVVTQNTGRNIRMDEDIFFYGLSFGAELRY